jgi:NDP-sugar pyrophosphorylase family protein/aminoglycoside/choline kinase family phosphotransferase
MRPPKKAIVLAAGYGARFLPLTLMKPKPLFPLWGKPALGHALELLKSWGVQDVLVNAHYHAGQILEYIKGNPVPGLRCQLSYEPDILGTGGALPKAHWFMDEDPFWMLNSDVLADLSCKPLLDSHRRHGSIATLWLHSERGPRTVEHRNGLVTVFKSPMAGTEGTATFCGLQLLSPRILNFLPPSGFSSIIDAYENALVAGEKIGGVIVPNSYWADIGKPEAYLATHIDMMTHPRWKNNIPRGKIPIACGRDTTVAPGAEVARSVLWDHVTVASGAKVENAIVADDVTVRSHVSYMAMRADHMQDTLTLRVLKKLGWSPDATTVMPLPPRGSARTFTRLVTPAESAILVKYTLERPENGLYTRHARFLARCGVQVPEVLVDWPDEQICVLDDVGESSLEQLVPTLSRSAAMALYRQTLDTVARLHSHATRAFRRTPVPLSMPFTRHLYEWEQNLFCEQFLGRHREVDNNAMAAIRKELARLIPAQLRAQRVIVHRDLQSSNVLVRDGGIFLIDFQGMRLGTAAYDLASLLCDPYVNLPDDMRDELLDYYLGLIPDSGAVRDLFWVAAVERLSQALGAFGRLGAVSTTSYFLKHIPSGVKQLQHALSHVPGLPTLKGCLEG